ncbi:Uncharacterized protein PODLI_1B026413, partial [Podarcis lilfordi]
LWLLYWIRKCNILPVNLIVAVMLAASYWSLLAPAIELAEDSGKFGAFAFFPVAVGFTLGAAFVYFADLILPWLDFAAAAAATVSLPPSAPGQHRMQAVQLSQKPEQQEGLLLSLCVLWSGASYRAKNTQIPAPNPNILCALKQDTLSFSTAFPSGESFSRVRLFVAKVSLPYITTGKTMAFTIRTFVGKQASFNFVTAVTICSDHGAQERGDGPIVPYPVLTVASCPTWSILWHCLSLGLG